MNFADLPPERQKSIRECLLNSFPNSTWCGYVLPPRDGTSGAGVFYTYFSQRRGSGTGLNGYYVVKIGPAEWASELQLRYRDIRVNGMEEAVVDYCGATFPFECEGFAAVASKPALNSHFTKTLRELIEDSAHYTSQIPRHIGAILATFADWNRDKLPVTNDRLLTPLEMISDMLGANLTRVLPRLVTAPFCWYVSAHLLEALFITVDRLDMDAKGATRRELPNPLAFLRNVAWYEMRNQQNDLTSSHWLDFLAKRYPCPVGRIHGDLNTSNIICRVASGKGPVELPVVVDFDEDFKVDGVPFYDYAYLEIDVLFHSLPPDVREHRAHWVELLPELMAQNLVPRQRVAVSAEVRRSLSYIRPIRQAVRDLCTGKPPYERNVQEERELAWWAATVAAGLNFASKKKHMTAAKRRAALLYAAHGLQRLFQGSGNGGDLIIGTPPLVMPWFLDGEIEDGNTLEAWNLRQNYFAALSAHGDGEENEKPVQRVHLLLPQPIGSSSSTNHWVGLQERLERLVQKDGDMARRLEEERYTVTCCSAMAQGTLGCPNCSNPPNCSHASESEVVILLLENEATQPANLLAQMGFPPHKALVMVPRHIEDILVMSPGKFDGEIVYFAPEDYVVRPAQRGGAQLPSPNKFGDDLTNRYVVAKALQYARKRSLLSGRR